MQKKKSGRKNKKGKQQFGKNLRSIRAITFDGLLEQKASEKLFKTFFSNNGENDFSRSKFFLDRNELHLDRLSFVLSRKDADDAAFDGNSSNLQLIDYPFKKVIEFKLINSFG